MFDEVLLKILLEADEETLPSLVLTYQLNLDTIYAIKEKSDGMRLVNPIQAESIAKLAYKISEQLPLPAIAVAHTAIANVLIAQTRPSLASSHYIKAREIFKQLGLDKEFARSSIGYIGSLSYERRYQDAIAIANEIIPILLQSSDPKDRNKLGGAYNNLGIAWDMLGYHEKALGAYSQKLQIASENQNRSDMASTHQNRARSLTWMNLYAEASQAFQDCIDLSAEGDFSTRAKAYLNLGLLQMRLGKSEQAEIYFSEAMRYLQDDTNTRYMVLLYRTLNNSAKQLAFEALLQAEREFSKHGPNYAHIMSLLLIGRKMREAGEWDNATGIYELALKSAEQSTRWQVLHEYGLLAEAMSNIDEAVLKWEKAIDAIELHREYLTFSSYRAAFVADKLIVYQALVHLLMYRGEIDKAFFVLERARARMLAEKMGDRLSQQSEYLLGSDNIELSQDAHQFKQTMNTLAIQTRIVEGGNTTLNDAKKLEQLQEYVSVLAQKIESASSQFSVLSTNQLVSLSAIAPEKESNYAIAYYHSYQQQLFCYLILPGGKVVNLQLCRLDEFEQTQQNLSEMVQRTLTRIEVNPEKFLRRFGDSVEKINKVLSELHHLIMSPILEQINSADIEHICIVPEPILFNIPFHALRLDDHYLTEKFTLSVVNSATILAYCRRAIAKKDRSIFAIGYKGKNLALVNDELDLIQKLYPNAVVLAGENATADDFLARAGQASMIHLASHAHFKHDKPLLSFFELAGRNLTLAEIINLRLDAELVTLSACETGLGRIHGSDLISLSSGFMGAGARSLLVTLWPVVDNVAVAFMGLFYGALSKGVSRARAMQIAQLGVIEQGENAEGKEKIFCHPIFWSPFTLVGDWSPIL